MALLPGPSSLLIAAQARALGLGAALAALGGHLLACAMMVGLVGTGLGQALAALPALLDAIRILGFAWLGWIVWSAVRRRGKAGEPAERVEAAALFAQGFLTCAANPKLILHLAAFLPLFLDPARPLAPQLALIAATQVLRPGARRLAAGGRLRLAIQTWSRRPDAGATPFQMTLTAPGGMEPDREGGD